MDELSCSNQGFIPPLIAYPSFVFKDIILSILSCLSCTISFSPLIGSFYLVMLILLSLSVIFSLAIVSFFGSPFTGIFLKEFSKLLISFHAPWNLLHLGCCIHHQHYSLKVKHYLHVVQYNYWFSVSSYLTSVKQLDSCSFLSSWKFFTTLFLVQHTLHFFYLSNYFCSFSSAGLSLEHLKFQSFLPLYIHLRISLIITYLNAFYLLITSRFKAPDWISHLNSRLWRIFTSHIKLNMLNTDLLP